MQLPRVNQRPRRSISISFQQDTFLDFLFLERLSIFLRNPNSGECSRVRLRVRGPQTVTTLPQMLTKNLSLPVPQVRISFQAQPTGSLPQRFQA